MRTGRETSTHYFSCSGGHTGFHKNRVGTHYGELVFFASSGIGGSCCALHCVQGAKHRCTIFHAREGPVRSAKKRPRARYAELVFFHLVGSAGHVVNSAAPGA
jgi:hypothetical protein